MATQTAQKSNTQTGECVDNPIGWVEIPVTNLERAKTFYGKSFDFTFEARELAGYQMAVFPMIHEGKGSSGALIQGETYVPSHEGVTVYFSTPNIESALEKIKANGGKVIQPKKSIGEFGHIAFFEDSEGNRIALHSKD